MRSTSGWRMGTTSMVLCPPLSRADSTFGGLRGVHLHSALWSAPRARTGRQLFHVQGAGFRPCLNTVNPRAEQQRQRPDYRLRLGASTEQPDTDDDRSGWDKNTAG